MSFKDRLLKLKQVLPANGDWLCPTPAPVPVGSVEDLAETYSDPENVLEAVPTPLSSEIADAVLAEANRIAQAASVRADTVRDKAKVLLGTSSFVGAVVTGILSFSFQHIKVLPTWISLPFIVLFALMLVQFGFSLVRSIRAMTRETLHELTPRELGRIIQVGGELEEFKRRLAATRFALANKTSIFVTQKVNDLILGQVGFGFGLFYALILLFVFAIAFVTSDSGISDIRTETTTAQAIRVELLTITGTLQKQLIDLQNTYSAQGLSIRNELDRLVSRFDDLITRLQKTPKKSSAVERELQKSKEPPSKSGTR